MSTTFNPLGYILIDFPSNFPKRDMGGMAWVSSVIQSNLPLSENKPYNLAYTSAVKTLVFPVV